MSMIYITGDCHAEFQKLNMNHFPEQKKMTRDDFVIVCGDFGGIWADRPEERYWLNWLEQKKFTLLFVCGNHENFERLYNEFPVMDFHGGKAHRIRENIFHLMRGGVFELCGKKIFAFGGASSHDISDGILDPKDFANKEDFRRTMKQWCNEGKMFRVKGRSWWEQELPTREEMDYGLWRLMANDYKVDFIISHCCPQRIVEKIVGSFAESLYPADCLTRYFDDVMERTLFTKWYFGHYHDDMQIMEKFIMLYDRVMRIV